MDVQAILNKIDEDARTAATKVLEEARRKAAVLRAQSESRMKKKRQELETRLQQDGDALEDRMIRMAALEDKRLLLTDKREVMDAAFKEAARILRDMPAKEARAFFLKQAVRASGGTEQLLPGEHSTGIINGSFVEELNAFLQSQGKPAHVTLAADTVPGAGFVLKQEGAQINCTLESLIMSIRQEEETQAASILFG